MAHQNAGALIDELSHKYSGEHWAEKQMRPNQAGDSTRRAVQRGVPIAGAADEIVGCAVFDDAAMLEHRHGSTDSKPSRGAELIAAAAWFLLLPSSQSK